jgi:glutamate dehydrogenase
MQHLLSLSPSATVIMSFYQSLSQDGGQLHCKLYHAGTPLPLSDVLPILENLGLRVLGEFPFKLRRADGREFWIHDFAFTRCRRLDVGYPAAQRHPAGCLRQYVGGAAENDAFNRLVLIAGHALARCGVAACLCPLPQADPPRF